MKMKTFPVIITYSRVEKAQHRTTITAESEGDARILAKYLNIPGYMLQWKREPGTSSWCEIGTPEEAPEDPLAALSLEDLDISQTEAAVPA